MRWFYSLLWWVSLPLVLMRLWWRGRKEPGYRQHIAERLGFYDPKAPAGRESLWIDRQRLAHWQSKGAALSPTAALLVKQMGAQQTPQQPA